MFTAPKGVRDILPAQSFKWKYVENIICEALENFGFAEIRLPIFESTQLFTRSIGTDTDIVSKEMYTFTDRGERSFSLRPEGTASVVRAYLEHKMFSASPYSKLYYQGPMFRAERPQAGRYRQFYQIGAEVFAAGSPYIDAEILIMLDMMCRRLDLVEFEIQLNSVGCPLCRPLYRAKLADYLKEKSEHLCEDCKRRSLTNPMRVFDCKSPKCKEALAGAPLITNSLGQECREHFETVKNLLDAQGIKYVLNPNLVRGLDYYTQTAFELVSTKLGAQNAFAGGGRYDQLVSEMGGPQIPAIGFAIGMDRLVSLLEESIPESGRRPVFLALMGEAAQKEGLSLLIKLREAKILAEMDYAAGSLKNQLKKANKLEARFCLILGEEEINKNIIILRDMGDGSQRELSKESLSRWICEYNG